MLHWNRVTMPWISRLSRTPHLLVLEKVSRAVAHRGSGKPRMRPADTIYACVSRLDNKTPESQPQLYVGHGCPHFLIPGSWARLGDVKKYYQIVKIANVNFHFS